MYAKLSYNWDIWMRSPRITYRERNKQKEKPLTGIWHNLVKCMWLHSTVWFCSFKLRKISLRMTLVTTPHTCAQQDTAFPPSDLSHVGQQLPFCVESNSHHAHGVKFSSHLHGNGRTKRCQSQVTMSDFQSEHQN